MVVLFTLSYIQRFGSLGWLRTNDILINSQALYRAELLENKAFEAEVEICIPYYSLGARNTS